MASNTPPRLSGVPPVTFPFVQFTANGPEVRQADLRERAREYQAFLGRQLIRDDLLLSLSAAEVDRRIACAISAQGAVFGRPFTVFDGKYRFQRLGEAREVRIIRSNGHVSDYSMAEKFAIAVAQMMTAQTIDRLLRPYVGPETSTRMLCIIFTMANELYIDSLNRSRERTMDVFRKYSKFSLYIAKDLSAVEIEFG